MNNVFHNMKYIILLFFFAEMFSSTPLKPKLCCDCKFFIKDFFLPKRLGSCAIFPKDQDKDDRFYLVDGIKPKVEYSFCSIAREYKDMCGPDGIFYEKK